MAKERLQKILAQAGVSSRRHAEQLIVLGKVRVNGRIVTELGVQADAHEDRIEVNGKRVVAEQPVYFLLNKPKGVVSTLDDPEGRPHLGELLKNSISERVYPVGRLDFHTSGVLLITNDGAMTEALLHPKKDVPKTYVAKFGGHLEDIELQTLRNGVVLDDGETTRPCDLFVIREEEKCTWLEITLKEGRNRQIHRMAEALGKVVLRLSRISFAGLTAEALRPGMVRPLSDAELDKLKRDYLNPKKLEGVNTPLGHDGGYDRRRDHGSQRGYVEELQKRRPHPDDRARRKPAPREEESFASNNSSGPRGDRPAGRARTAAPNDRAPRDATSRGRDKAPADRFPRDAAPTGREKAPADRFPRDAAPRGRDKAPPDRFPRDGAPRGRDRTPRVSESPRDTVSRARAPQRDERGARGFARSAQKDEAPRPARAQGPSRNSTSERKAPVRAERPARGDRSGPARPPRRR